jgi:putative transposase
MPLGLHRTYGAYHLHFITCSCYRRLPFLSTARSRDSFLSILEQTRQRYRFVVVGYVVMPEHFHLLITEPETGNPSTVMQVLKQRSAHALLPKRKRRDRHQRQLFPEEMGRAFWQARFYDFNVWTTKKRVEKLRYMHRNPVKRGLVDSPEQWRWSSYRFYLFEESGSVRINEGWGKISFQDRAAKTGNASVPGYPPLQKTQERGTHNCASVGISKPGPPASTGFDFPENLITQTASYPPLHKTQGRGTRFIFCTND